MEPASERNDVAGTLNRLLAILTRSLPRYLEYAPPWSRGDEQPARAALTDLAGDEAYYAAKVADALVARGERPDPGGFPMEFTSINDASLDYLLGQVVARQGLELQEVHDCADRLAADSELRELAEEIYGNLSGHQEILEKLVDGLAANGRSPRGDA
jgi:hypothetical protein